MQGSGGSASVLGDGDVTSASHFDHDTGDCTSEQPPDNIKSVKDDARHAPVAELRQAVDVALTKDWQSAHLIAQKYEDDDVAG